MAKLEPYTIPEQDADLWECGVDLTRQAQDYRSGACPGCGVYVNGQSKQIKCWVCGYRVTPQRWSDRVRLAFIHSGELDLIQETKYPIPRWCIDVADRINGFPERPR
jgi:DNA-directed RNA polymerase subunit RPC12/RpoP